MAEPEAPSDMREGGETPLQIGLFDIMQIDPLSDAAEVDIAAMYARRLDQLSRADELGFSIAFTAERHFMGNYACPSATAWIAAASQRTVKMRLGVLGYTLPMRAPIQLAEDIAVLDLLANGRLEIGLGLGHRVEELIAVGIDPADRIPLFQERLALLQGLWTGGTVTYARDSVIARDVTISPLPTQVPYPPLWFAGTEPVAAHWMGTRGLGLAVGFKPTDQLVTSVAAFLAGRQSRSNAVIEGEPARPSGAVALMRAVYVSDTDAEAMDEITDDLLRLEETFGDGAANRPDRRAEARSRASAMVRDDVMLAGGPETVARAIVHARAELPFDLLLANVHGAGMDEERIERTMRLLATRVWPETGQPVRA